MSTSLNTAFTNWKLQLEDWVVSEEGQDGYKALEDYNEATDGRTEASSKVRLTLGEPEALILGALEEDGTNEDRDVLVRASIHKVRLFHSPIIIGGTRARKEKKLIVLPRPLCQGVCFREGLYFQEPFYQDPKN
jgi:hypothetical protein